MSEAAMPQKAPYPQQLEPGDYWWCACGLSKNQPFCDGSHKTTSITPLKFSIAAAEQKWLCGCKRSAKAPFCDGTHNRL